jgi:hypothetical protein
VLPQSDRLPLHFEKPAVQQRPLVHVSVPHQLGGLGHVVLGADPLPQCVQLVDQRLEDAPDSNERRRPFFVQLADESFMSHGDFAEVHGIQTTLGAGPAHSFRERTSCRQPFR